MLGTSAYLAVSSVTYGVICTLQVALYLLALVGSGRGIPGLRKVAGAANAFCMLNVAAVVGFYKFMFTHGPLWKIWSAPGQGATAESEERTHAATGV
jgi:hypothetical protein